MSGKATQGDQSDSAVPDGWRLSMGWPEIEAATILGHETDAGFTVYADPAAAIDAHYVMGSAGRLSRLYVKDRRVVQR